MLQDDWLQPHITEQIEHTVTNLSYIYFCLVYSFVDLTGERFETDTCNCQLENVACICW